MAIPWDEIIASGGTLLTAVAGMFGYQKYQAKKEARDESPARAVKVQDSAHTIRLKTQKERLHELQESIKNLGDKVDALEQDVTRLSAVDNRVIALADIVRSIGASVSEIKADIAVLKDRTERDR